MLFKNKIKQIISQNNQIISQNKEMEWANIYHDSIRGKVSIQNLAINIGRWAGNYSFFYVLNRILSDYKPNSILELGLGESTKFISTFIKDYLSKTNHTVIEHDKDWIESFQNNFSLSQNSKIVQCDIETKIINQFECIQYSGLEKKIDKKYNLYIIDGPFGSDNYSRQNIVHLIDSFNVEDEFIIILDDYERKGEQDTARDLETKLIEKEIKFYKATYSGVKSQLVIVTEKYKYATSL